MPEPTVEIIKHHATGKYYIKYISQYLGPYREMVACNKSSDMLTIKLALDGGRTTLESLAGLQLFYPVNTYYKTNEALERARDVTLSQFLVSIKDGGARCNEFRQVTQRGQQAAAQELLPRAQPPTRPKHASEAPLSIATSTPAKRASLQRGRNDVRKVDVTPLAACRKRPISGPTNRPSQPKTDIVDLVDSDDMEVQRVPGAETKNALLGSLPPGLCPRISSPFRGVRNDQHKYYAEIQIPSTSLAPPSLENALGYHKGTGTPPKTAEKDITLRTVSCETEEEAALAHDLLVLWRTAIKGHAVPRPDSLNYPLTELQKHIDLVQAAQSCETSGLIKAFVDHWIESWVLRKLVTLVPGGAAARNRARALACKTYAGFSDEAAEDQSEEEEMPFSKEKGGRKRLRGEIVEREEEYLDNRPKLGSGYAWTQVENDVMVDELISKLGKSWRDKVGRHSGCTRVYRHVGELLRGLGYDRTDVAVRARALRLKENNLSSVPNVAQPQRSSRRLAAAAAAANNRIAASQIYQTKLRRQELKEVRAPAMPQQQQQQQQEQEQEQEHSTAIDTGTTDDDVISLAVAFALVPDVPTLPLTAPTPGPLPTVDAMLEDIETLEMPNAMVLAVPQPMMQQQQQAHQHSSAAISDRINSLPASAAHVSVPETSLTAAPASATGPVSTPAVALGAAAFAAVYAFNASPIASNPMPAPTTAHPAAEMGQQQQQQELHGGANAATTAAVAGGGRVGSSAATAGFDPAPAPMSAPPATFTAALAAAATPPPTVNSNEMLRLLQQTPGLSRQDICKFMAKCGGSAQNRAWHLDTLREYADDPSLVRMYVEETLAPPQG